MKRIDILAIITALFFIASCTKKELSEDQLMYDVVTEQATLELSKANFTTAKNNLVKARNANYFESGSMDYLVDGVTEATITFQSGGQCSLSKNGISSKKSLKGKSHQSKKYTMVVVSPIVKVANCKYIVQGIVEYYDDNNNLLATIDFGNGTCDEWAVKSFPNKPDYTFSQDDWFKK